MTSTLNEIWVVLAGDNGPCFRGLKADVDAGRTWNGFECPLFTKDEAERVLTYLNQADDPSQYDWTYLESEDAFLIAHPDNINGDIDVFTGRLVYDGDSNTDIILYALGAFAWTWVLADEDAADFEIERRWSAKTEAAEIAALANPEGLGRMDLDDYRAAMGFE